MNLPNQITLSRLGLAIVFFAVLAQFDLRNPEPRYWLLDVCVVLFIIAAATDWLDGHLARKRNQVTAFGRILDPFVDKVLVCGTFVLLAGPAFATDDGRQATCVAPWMVVLIMGREMLVTGLRGFSESKGKAFGASVYGKAKMVIQSFTAPTLLVFIAHFDALKVGPSLAWIKVALVWLTVLATTLSMISYLHASRHLLLETDQA
jgi:CDP-diacylglycerol--glycerol-3-phosphate 3-phosphatidyltransferase